MRGPAHNRKNLVGQVFGMLTVLSPAEKKVYKSGGRTQYLCRCSCGEQVTVLTCSLSSGNTKSCGCAGKVRLSIMNTVHGMTGTKVYRAWQAMLNRCRNKNLPQYKDWGGRGIRVCKRWHRFENFLEDMGEPANNQSLDRVDNDGGYSKDNCRWATKKEQVRNKRSNRIIKFNGESKTLIEWAEGLGIDQASLRERISKWPLDKALTEPRRK